MYQSNPARRFALVALFAICAGPTFAETAIPPEQNPPGDIPDSQVFITYEGPGFSMQVPEGWSRTDLREGARFSDKYNILEVKLGRAASAPTVDSVTASEASELKKSGRAVEITGIKKVELTDGPAIRIDYTANSEPNVVTNKQIRLEDVRFLLFKDGVMVTLDMAAPLGADNVDQWNVMSNSVHFQ